jgi:hypothetical protein
LAAFFLQADKWSLRFFVEQAMEAIMQISVKCITTAGR